MKNNQIRIALLPLVAIVLAFAVGAGCGGGGSFAVVGDTTVTTASFPRAQLVPRIDRICRQGWNVILDNFAEYSRFQEPKGSAEKRFEKAVRESLLAGITFHIFDEIYQMGAPPGEEQEVEEIIGSLLYATQLGEKKLAPVGSLAQISELFDEYNQLAQSFGIDECLVDEARLKPIRRS